MLARTMGAKISAPRNSLSARSWMDVLSEQGRVGDGAAIWQLASNGDAFDSSPGMLLSCLTCFSRRMRSNVEWRAGGASSTTDRLGFFYRDHGHHGRHGKATCRGGPSEGRSTGSMSCTDWGIELQKFQKDPHYMHSKKIIE